MITRFKNQYGFLSNFYPVVVSYEGKFYPSVEHAYQAAKTFDLMQRNMIASKATPSEAKKAGKSVIKRSDWEEVKLSVPGFG